MKELIQIMKEFREFNHHWDSYTFQERRTIIADFKKRLYESGNKPLEI